MQDLLARNEHFRRGLPFCPVSAMLLETLHWSHHGQSSHGEAEGSIWTGGSLGNRKDGEECTRPNPYEG